jgi:hypothetical protein
MKRNSCYRKKITQLRKRENELETNQIGNVHSHPPDIGYTWPPKDNSRYAKSQSQLQRTEELLCFSD